MFIAFPFSIFAGPFTDSLQGQNNRIPLQPRLLLPRNTQQPQQPRPSTPPHRPPHEAKRCFSNNTDILFSAVGLMVSSPPPASRKSLPDQGKSTGRLLGLASFASLPPLSVKS